MHIHDLVTYQSRIDKAIPQLLSFLQKCGIENDLILNLKYE